MDRKDWSRRPGPRRRDAELFLQSASTHPPIQVMELLPVREASLRGLAGPGCGARGDGGAPLGIVHRDVVSKGTSGYVDKSC